MTTLLADIATADYGHPVFARDGFRCVYCGFDGNGFAQWRQLSLDPLRPKSAGGTDDADNLVTACNFCAAATRQMKFAPALGSAEILTLKKERVKELLLPFHRFWKDQVAPRDGVLTPAQGGPYLPYPLLLDVSSLRLSDGQLEKISADNANLRIELTAPGELVIMPPTHTETGWQEGELLYQVTHWAKSNGSGVTFSPSAGFRLPNGAVYAPDVAWMPRERWESWLDAQAAKDAQSRESFVSFCPDFVLELRSPTDTLVSVQRKMAEYIANGARLGWLLDPIQKRVHIYRPDAPAEVLDNPATISGDPVLPGFELNLREIWP